MRSSLISEKEWIPLREASTLTGRSVHALRLLINRKRVEKVKKIQENGLSYWLIHRDVINQIGVHDKGDRGPSHESSSNPYQPPSHEHLSPPSHDPSQVISIPLQHYEERRKEWESERDQLLQGLMMYRYKFEEMDRKMRLLPAPPELISEDIKKRNEITEQARRALAQAQKDLEAERTSRKESLMQAQKLIDSQDQVIREKDEVIMAEIEHRDQLSTILQEKEQAIAQAEHIITDTRQKNQHYEESLAELQKKLSEEAHAKEAYRIELERAMEETRKPWWKKLFKI